ncbi:uncharacterized protein LOC123877333 isoform X2 [Maniola jurtina]|uniref:uncharacterized protein LOC123877333 isoform X2 n=1 Tax=Maniola jurtina TaxID=191418 RepID=UPI001E68A8F6|nr:uncharacterized protein LOC123877333 isoform X2 [Maniola jurtina]
MQFLKGAGCGGTCSVSLKGTEQIALGARMSVLNQSGEEQVECPLCMEPLEVDDLHFYPCTCGYQICRFCWNRIREGENGLCPACRKAYPENPADFTPLSQEQVAAIKTEKKAREQKRRNKTLESRRALANVRVVQNNLVFVVGLPVRLADPEILKRQEYFGKYGKIHKVVINQSTSYAGTQGPSASAYVTYVSPADALRAIQGVNNVTLDGRVLKGSLGTTKYCANFMKNQPCPKPDCMYLHELGDPKASFTKEEMHAGLHQVYERRLHQQLLQAQRDRPDDKHATDGNSSTNAEKGSSKDGNQSNFIPTTVVTSSQGNVVSTSKSKKDSGNGSNSNGNSSNGVSNSNGKEAWPSLGSSPPSDSPARKQSSPKPQQLVKSQENGTSESSSPTQLRSQSQTKNSKENHMDSKPSKSNKDTSNTNGQTSKKSKSDSKSKQKNSNSITNEIRESQTYESKTQQEQSNINKSQNSVFENDTQNYLSNELDELESDRHSLLENHDLLDNSDHSLLEDDNTHNLLNDANNEVMMMQRHREMLAGLVDNNHLMPQMKSPLVNGYGLLDRDSMYLGNDRQISQINHNLMEQKEMLLRERSRSNMLLRQNEMLARQHNAMVEPKHYNMPTSSIGLEAASELLGANYHPNHNMLPPFGMRVDNSMGASSLGNTMSANSMSNMTANSLSANTMANPMGSNSLSANSMGNSMGNPMSNSMGPSMANSMGNSMVNSMGGPMANSMGSSIANSMGSSMANSMGSAMANSMGSSMANSMGNSMANSMGSSMANAMGYLMHNQQMAMRNQAQMHSGLVNGYDTQSANEGRYQAENMDKFFTDFHKAQQMRLLLSRGEERRLEHMPHTHSMLSAERLEMEHKQRMSNLRAAEVGGRAAGDADDDLDFDPFSETQKALAEMMESEVMLNVHNISSGDNMERLRRSRLPPPGFSPMNTFGMGAPQARLQPHHQDWTQMDPAIMSTSVNATKSPPRPELSAQQQELFARFNQLQVAPNGVKMPQWQLQWPLQHNAAYNAIPLPPGFSPANNPAECIDAK